jgi:hypothetical protein
MVEADGIVVGQEMDALAALRHEMGLPVMAETVPKGDVEQLVSAFSSRRAKVAALLELLGLGYSDAEFHLDEKSLITVIAHEMKITAEDLALLEGWVKHHVRHIQQAFTLMQEG